MEMSVFETEQDFSAIAKLNGEFDAVGCRDIRQSFEQLIVDYSGKDLAIDLSDVSFMDSSGIGAIVFLYKRMILSEGSVALIGVKNQPKELLTLLRVYEAIPVVWAQDTSH